MGAVESELEHEYYEESLANVNPSTVEFEYWVSIHNVFKEVYEIPKLLQNIQLDLASQALRLPVGRPLDSEQCETIGALDQAAQTIVKAEALAANCTKFCLQVLNNAYQAAFFKMNHEKTSASALKRLTNYASDLFTSKCEAEQFPFDFVKYKASILEVAHYLHFMLDFDTYTQEETGYLLMMQTYQKLFTKEMQESMRSRGLELKSTVESVAGAAKFLLSSAPLAKLFSAQAASHGTQQLPLYEQCLGRVVIACCITLHKNMLLDVDEDSVLLKAITEGILVLDLMEPLGCFSQKMAQKLPSLVAVQTLALYANGVNPDLQEIALTSLCRLRTRCRMPKDTPEVIQKILEAAMVRAREEAEAAEREEAAKAQEAQEVPAEGQEQVQEEEPEQEAQEPESEAKTGAAGEDEKENKEAKEEETAAREEKRPDAGKAEEVPKETVANKELTLDSGSASSQTGKEHNYSSIQKAAAIVRAILTKPSVEREQTKPFQPAGSEETVRRPAAIPEPYELVYDSSSVGAVPAEGLLYPDCVDLTTVPVQDSDAKKERRRLKREAGLSAEEKAELGRRLPSLDLTRKKLQGNSTSSADIVFNSQFESGNLKRVYKVAAEEYYLLLENDSGTRHYAQWFYFSVCNGEQESTYHIPNQIDLSIRISIVNLAKAESLYKEGMKPCVFSTKKSQTQNVGWERGGTCISYRRNVELNPKLAALKLWDSVKYLSTLSFTFTFEHAHDCVYIAHSFPYTYTRLQHVVRGLKKDPALDGIFAAGTLTYSLACNPCYLCVISDDIKACLGQLKTRVPVLGKMLEKKLASTKGTAKEPDNARPKPGVVLTGRIHPGETNSSYLIEGLIKFLLSSDAKARKLREKYDFYVVPMLNPDGVACGNYRCSLIGTDLNRQWLNPSKLLFPTIFSTKQLVSDLSAAISVFSYCDFHGHSSKKDAFLMGCSYPPTDAEYKEKNARIKLLPFLLSRLNSAFSSAASTFALEKNKETTGRVVIFKEFGVSLSYTLETSFYGSDGVLSNTVETAAGEARMKRDVSFSIEYLKLMGRDVATGYLVLDKAMQLNDGENQIAMKRKEFDELVKPYKQPEPKPRPVPVPTVSAVAAKHEPCKTKNEPGRYATGIGQKSRLQFKLRKTINRGTALASNTCCNCCCQNANPSEHSLLNKSHDVRIYIPETNPLDSRNETVPQLLVKCSSINVRSLSNEKSAARSKLARRTRESNIRQHVALPVVQVTNKEGPQTESGRLDSTPHYKSSDTIEMQHPAGEDPSHSEERTTCPEIKRTQRTCLPLGQYLAKYNPGRSTLNYKHFNRKRLSKRRVLREPATEHCTFEEPSFRDQYHATKLRGPILSNYGHLSYLHTHGLHAGQMHRAGVFPHPGNVSVLLL